jgi:hypothetical protein
MAKPSARPAFVAELEQTVYTLDRTTIDLGLSLFPWARFRRRKGAVKLHTLLDLRGNIPTLVRMTHGKTHDVTVLDHLPIEPGAFYVMDRGHVDFRRLHRFTTCSGFFVTRAKRGLDFSRRTRRRVDQTIVLVGPKTSRLDPDPCVALWRGEFVPGSPMPGAVRPADAIRRRPRAAGRGLPVLRPGRERSESG